MTREQIIALANDAELCQQIWIDDICIEIDSLVAFAKLVAAKEREACAKVCEEEGKLWSKAGCTDTQTFALCATVIRARGEA
jgi:hypothetical protein